MSLAHSPTAGKATREFTRIVVFKSGLFKVFHIYGLFFGFLFGQVSADCWHNIESAAFKGGSL